MKTHRNPRTCPTSCSSVTRVNEGIDDSHTVTWHTPSQPENPHSLPTRTDTPTLHGVDKRLDHVSAAHTASPHSAGSHDSTHTAEPTESHTKGSTIAHTLTRSPTHICNHFAHKDNRMLKHKELAAVAATALIFTADGSTAWAWTPLVVKPITVAIASKQTAAQINAAIGCTVAAISIVTLTPSLLSIAAAAAAATLFQHQ